jgi:hypothetical protein
MTKSLNKRKNGVTSEWGPAKCIFATEAFKQQRPVFRVAWIDAAHDDQRRPGQGRVQFRHHINEELNPFARHDTAGGADDQVGISTGRERQSLPGFNRGRRGHSVWNHDNFAAIGRHAGRSAVLIFRDEMIESRPVIGGMKRYPPLEGAHPFHFHK